MSLISLDNQKKETLRLAGRNRGSFVEGIDILALSEAKMLELAICILQKPIVDRQHKEIELLRKYTENIKCFVTVIENLGSEAHAEMCQKMGHKAIDAGATLFEVGSIGYEFYMILKGRVEVWIKIRKGYRADGTEDFEMKKVAELDVGSSFGELAIMEEAIKPRAATIIAKEDCIFGTLDRKTYKSILGKYHRLETFAKINFLAQIPIFHGWSFHELKAWVYLFEGKEKHKRKTVIYKEGDLADMIYIVKSGEVKVTKVVDLPYKKQDAEDILLDDTKSLLVYEKDPIKKSVEIVTIAQGHMFGEEEAWLGYKLDQDLMRLGAFYDDKKNNKAKQKKDNASSFSDSDTESDADADDAGPKEQTAEDKIRAQMPRRVTTVTVHSYEAEIWSIPRKNFFAKLSQSVQSIKTLLETIQTKKDFREQRIKDIQTNVQGHISILRGNPKYDNEDLKIKITAKKYLRNEHKEEIIYKGDVRYMDYITGNDSPQNSNANLNTTFLNTKYNTSQQNTYEYPTIMVSSPNNNKTDIKYYNMPDLSTLRHGNSITFVNETSDASAQRSIFEVNSNIYSTLSAYGSPTRMDSLQTPKDVLIVDHPMNTSAGQEDSRLNLCSSAKPKLLARGTDHYINEKIADKVRVAQILKNNEEAHHKDKTHFFKLLAEPREKKVDLSKYAVKLPNLDKPEKGKVYDRDYIRTLNQKEDESELVHLSPFQRTTVSNKTRYPMASPFNKRSSSFDHKLTSSSRKNSVTRDIHTAIPKPMVTGYRTNTEKFRMSEKVKESYGGTPNRHYRPGTMDGSPQSPSSVKSNKRYSDMDNSLYYPVGMVTMNTTSPEKMGINPNLLSPPPTMENVVEVAREQIKKSMGYVPALNTTMKKRAVSADPPVNIHMAKLHKTQGENVFGFVRRRKKKTIEVEGKGVNMTQYISKYKTKARSKPIITDMSLIDASVDDQKSEQNFVE